MGMNFLRVLIVSHYILDQGLQKSSGGQQQAQTKKKLQEKPVFSSQRNRKRVALWNSKSFLIIPTLLQPIPSQSSEAKQGADRPPNSYPRLNGSRQCHANIPAWWCHAAEQITLCRTFSVTGRTWIFDSEFSGGF